jgi:hypothetical protein
LRGDAVGELARIGPGEPANPAVFYWSLFGESRKMPYPTAEVERVCAEIGFSPIATAVG